MRLETLVGEDDLGNPPGAERRCKLRFSPANIVHWASRYTFPGDDEIELLGLRIRSRGYLRRNEFLQLCHWKSPRTQPRCEENKAQFIASVTRVALSEKDEDLRIKVLTLLRGVSWPTASVILHFGSRQKYPILDFRALWSVGVHVPPVYRFELWWQYVGFTRNLARDHGVSMRTLDRALWQYSKENQA